ncbi:MAG: hypothetical protein IT260_00250 [Saprospiraceae bacterium]|nr:hypothetical protein [Saprospiraceae bacterium]
MSGGTVADFLRSPRGMLALFACTFAGAVLLAVAAAFNRPFFEKFVAEKYGVVTAQEDSLMRTTDPASFVRKVQLLTPGKQTRLYEIWMQRPGKYPEQMPAWILSGNRDTLFQRIRVTLLAGSAVQRQMAALFLSRTRLPEAKVMLLDERKRAYRRDEQDVVSYLDELLRTQ